MSDNDTPNENDKQNLIGIDPLAWLSDEEKASLDNTEQPQPPDTDEANETAAPQGNSSYTVSLDTMLTIRDASDLLEELNQIDPECNQIIIDVGQLERVDTAALQLLLGFYLFSVEAGKQVNWHKPTEPFFHAVQLLGLDDIINISPAIAA